MIIHWKSKAQTMHTVEGEELYQYIDVPTLARKHVDMASARAHRKYGSYANSDLFPAMLARIRRELLNGGAYLRLDRLPDNVTAEPGFLHTVTVTIA